MQYWKYRMVDKLRDYTAQVAAVENIKDQIEALESLAISIKSSAPSEVNIHGSGIREDRVLENIVMRNDLEDLLERTKKAVKTVERSLDVLPVDERRALEIMYINHQKGAVDTLAAEFCLADERSVYKRVDKALRHFTVAMCGCEVS